VVFLFAEKLTGFYLPAGGRTQYYIKSLAQVYCFGAKPWCIKITLHQKGAFCHTVATATTYTQSHTAALIQAVSGFIDV
jgi:hypothetical protein